jgi:DNA-binding NarL/FixJ family response regulator
MSGRVRVLVAEDQRLVREGIVTMLRTDEAFDVVAEAADGEQALREARRTRPDVALVDIRMPLLDGIETTRQLVRDLPEVRVLVLTTFGSDDLVLGALSAGASGFLLKDTRAESLLESVAAVARGEGRLDPAVTGVVVDHFRRHRTPRRAEVEHLTAREQEVLLLLARGMSNAEIAETLVVAPGTVKHHVATVLAKLGVRDRLQAVIRAYESGMVTPP